MGKIGKTLEIAVSKILELMYSKEKRDERILVFLTLFAFLLRLPAALNLDFLADDAIYASQSAGIWASGILSTHSHPPIFFYLTDLAYKIFGYTTFAARFFPLIAGTLLVPVVFLLTKKLFNKRIALYASFFAALSNFIIRMTFSEHSLVTFFFVFSAIYFGLIYLEKRTVGSLVICGILFGLGTLTKYNAVFFLVAFLLFAIITLKKNKEKIFTKQNIKHLVIFGLIIFLLAMPFLTFNYLTYKENGIMDFQFTRIFHPEKSTQLFSGLGGQDSSFLKDMLDGGKYINYNLLFKTDIIMLVFGLAGLGLLAYRKEKKALWFFLIFLLIPFLLQSPANALAKHFVFMSILFTIPAGYALNEIMKKINNRVIKIVILIVLVVLLFINLGTMYGTPSNYLQKSGTSDLKSYINNNVGPNDLLVFDSRIYTAKSYWLGLDHNLITSQQFTEFYNVNQENPRNMQLTNVYVVECLVDDCGWGWVSTNQEFNKSSELMMSSLANYSKSSYTAYDTTYVGNEIIGQKEKQGEYIVYKLSVLLNPQIVKQTKYINSFYFVPYMYLNMKDYVFNYNAAGMDSLLNNLSKYLIYIAILLAILFMITVIFWL